MIWPWSRRPRACPSPEAKQAHNRAVEDLQAAQDQWPEVHRVVESLRELRRRNHFAESIELMLREKRA